MNNNTDSPLFLETIRIVNGTIQALSYHQAPMKSTISVAPCLQIEVPQKYSKGLVKCRVIYDEMIHEISFQPYNRRIINTLKLVYSDSIDYRYKYADRSVLDLLTEQKAGCDDILIVKSGLLTDASFANLVIKKSGKWYTPAKPLLYGTMRQQLIDSHQIIEADLTPQDAYNAECICLVNAMNLLGEMPVKQIVE